MSAIDRFWRDRFMTLLMFDAAIATRIPMMALTTSISISVNPRR